MRLRPVLVTLLLAALSCGLLGPAQADDLQDRKRAADRAIVELRQDLADTDADLTEAVVALRRSEQRLSDAQQREGAAESALDAAVRKDRALAAKLRIAEDEQADAEAAQREARLARAQLN